MKKFIKENWFKLSIVILMIVFVSVLNSIAIKGIKIKHSGFIDMDMSGSVGTEIDGATLYIK